MTVPRLNLAPKRRRPLSLWNPIDYLLLLYWVFFFPQALRWYEVNFGIEQQLKDCKTWKQRFQWIQSAQLERKFWMQGTILSVSISSLLAFLIENLINISINPILAMLGTVFGIASGIGISTVVGIAEGVTGIIIFGIAGVLLGATANIPINVAGGFSTGILLGSIAGITVGIARGVAKKNVGGIAGGIWLGIIFGIILGIVGSITENIISGLTVGLTATSSLVFSILRPESLASYLGFSDSCKKPIISGNITCIPWKGLNKQLNLWLSQDWNTGIYNANQLLAYTQQFVAVVKSLERSLSKIPNDQLFSKTASLSSDPFDWDVVRYVSASFNNKVIEELVYTLFWLPSSQHSRKLVDSSLRVDLPYRAVAAGFWLLHYESPSKAAEAFSTVRNIHHGEEMYQIACCLATAQEAKTLQQKSALAHHQLPRDHLLRPQTWQAMAQLRHAADNAQLLLQSYSRSTRSLALNRALGALVNILDHSNDLPNAEKDLILDIAKSWRDDFLELASDVGEVDYSQPVTNPYVAGDPVEGDLFVGREDILKQLQELWLMGEQLQSVVLYGHRRMGKTSILRNLSACLGNNPKVVYVNLLTLGHVTEGVGEVLITISDSIAKTVELAAPKDDDLLRLPEITFKRYLQDVIKHLNGTGLIIALDEFEQLEELIKTQSLTPDFIKYLRGLVQLSPHIGFAFAGLHTLEEMTEDYFNPFFASVLPIHVDYLSQSATRQLVANPNPDFTLDYAPGVLDEIYSFTAGQPYLTQLLGFQLVRLYNHQRFEQNTDRPPTFTHDDLRQVTENTDLYSKGRYYFTGVWNQAGQDMPHQQPVLKVLADEPTGLPIEAIARKTKLKKTDVLNALQTLARHDVATEEKSHWRIIVPLFRRWVLQQQCES
ncbi:MAG: ATP-binding protein [Cyanobacteria bacterium P01_D01_bin.56]